MICPRCGAASQDARIECSACGIVFSRWRPRGERTPAELKKPEPASAASHRVNYWVVIPVVATMLFFGTLWARARRGSVEGQNATLVSDTSLAGGTAARGAVTGGEAVGDLSDDEIRKLIQECGYFQEPLTVKLPKSVSPGLMRLTAEQYPGLLLAANMGFVEFDPPFDASNAARYLSDPTNPGRAVSVKLGPQASTIPISDMGNEYRFDLGRRRVEQLSGVQRTPDRIGLFYRWTIEAPALLYFAPDHQEVGGGAELRRSATGWKAKVWRNTRSGALILCEE